MLKRSFTAPEAHILIVDDMPVNYKIIAGILSHTECEMSFAHNGTEALEKLSEHRYDLVIMDYMMPEMDGAEAVKRLRQREDEYFKKLPVIALSSFNTDEMQHVFEESGFSDFVTKPVEVEKLMGCIIKWLPPEKVTETMDAPDEDTEIREKAMAVDIPGIDPAKGIIFSGGAGFFLELLGDVHEIIDTKCALIEGHLARKEIRDFTTQVHALKTTCRMMGAMDLSGKFYKLEQLGTEENVSEIEALTPSALADFSALKPFLEPFVPQKEEGFRPYEQGKIAELLKELCTSIEDFNLSSADAQIKDLTTYSYPGELGKQIDDLFRLVEDLDYDEAHILAKEILANLN